MPAVSEPSLLLTSSLEEDGFEPSVPREREKIGVVDGIETPLSQSLSARRSAASPFSRGFCCSKLRAFSEMQAPTGPGGLERGPLRATGDFSRRWTRLVSMVKCPLIQVVYSLGVSARFASLHYDRAQPLPPPRSLGGLYWISCRQTPTPSSRPRKPRSGCACKRRLVPSRTSAGVGEQKANQTVRSPLVSLVISSRHCQTSVMAIPGNS
jgi:hypothetical protein